MRQPPITILAVLTCFGKWKYMYIVWRKHENMLRALSVGYRLRGNCFMSWNVVIFIYESYSSVLSCVKLMRTSWSLACHLFSIKPLWHWNQWCLIIWHSFEVFIQDYCFQGNQWYQCLCFHQVDFHMVNLRKCAGPWFNIKMTSYHYRKSLCGDKTVVRSSYLHNGISYTGKMTSLYWIRALFVSMFGRIYVQNIAMWMSSECSTHILSTAK